jgi:xylulose-5-phosphate/fructose-6-phosphate phosphoketolase
VPGLDVKAAGLRQHMQDERVRSRAYAKSHGEDPEAIRDWVWPG